MIVGDIFLIFSIVVAWNQTLISLIQRVPVDFFNRQSWSDSSLSHVIERFHGLRYFSIKVIKVLGASQAARVLYKFLWLNYHQLGCQMKVLFLELPDLGYQLSVNIF